MNNDERRREDWAVSPTLVTRYAARSSRLIRSIERNVFVVIGVVTVLAAISVIEAFEIMGITNFISEELDDTLIAILSLISLAALVPILRLSLRSKKTLEEWAEMFEYNSIKNSITMSLSSIGKEDVLRAVAEAVDEIEEPLAKYLEKGGSPELFDKQMGSYTCDILLDTDTVSPEKGQELGRVLEEYGPVVVKIVDGKIAGQDVEHFSGALKAYEASKGRRVGLAVMVGREIDSQAEAGRGRAKDIVLIEQP